MYTTTPATITRSTSTSTMRRSIFMGHLQLSRADSRYGEPFIFAESVRKSKQIPPDTA
jgi:hypothetical protein